MIPQEIQTERESLVSEIQRLRKEKSEFNTKIDSQIDSANFRITMLRSKCIHSYAEQKEAGVRWYKLGLCTYCGESDY